MNASTIETYPSETSRYRALTVEYCYACDGDIYQVPPIPGVGIDIASQGDPVVPWAFQLDLPPEEFAYYNSNHPLRSPVQLRGHADKLPLDSECLDFVYCSHLLEDYKDWEPVLKEWVRVLKPKGKLIVLIPDRELWVAACAKGQPPNDAHRHEGKVGELSTYAERLGLKVIEDRLTNLWEGDYTILFVAEKLAADT